MTNLQYISAQVTANTKSIEATLLLLSEDCTIPFIARYRKDRTGNLDEVLIEQIFKLNQAFEAITKRKEAIIKSITEQEALTAELQQKIAQTFDMAELEDLYLPYKKRKKTRADVAREKGLEPLAKIIMAQNADNIDYTASKYLNDSIPNEDEALQGARDIIAEWINENVYIRKSLRRIFVRKAAITTKITKAGKEDEKAKKFEQYFDWSENLAKAPSHRLLAMLRAENEGFIRFKVEVDNTEAIDLMEQSVIKNNRETAAHLKMAIDDSYKRLLAPAIANEALQEAKARADAVAIQVFAGNLGQLLLSPPLGEKRILAIDPGFRTGCKVVCLDEKGDLLYNETIFPHAPQNETAIAMKKIRSMVN
ncbi:MAG: RNA-binding transcriptional accessory protein, partial [Pedobacter sp.]